MELVIQNNLKKSEIEERVSELPANWQQWRLANTSVILWRCQKTCSLDRVITKKDLEMYCLLGLRRCMVLPTYHEG